MAENLNKVVEVYISRETAQLDTTSFNIPLLMVQLPDTIDNTDPGNPVNVPAVITQRAFVFTDLAGVAAEFGVNSVAHQMATKLLSGQNRPPTFIVGVKNTQETYVQGLTAVQNENDSWYIVMLDSKVSSDILAVAAWVQAQRKLYATSSSEAGILVAADDTDIASQLFNLSYDRTFGVYSAQADTEHPEAVWVGGQITATPGSNTWAFKQASGITVQNLNPSEQAALEAKNFSYFARMAGVALFLGGMTSQGEWIDTMIFVDWMYARIQEQVFYRFATKAKIPMTQAGAVIIESEIRSVLSQGVTNGGIADTPQYTVTAPNVMAIPEDQRARRIMGDFKFTARLAGAVHKTVIRGVVSY